MSAASGVTIKHWTIDDLKVALNKRKEIKGWVIHQEHIHRRERYFMLDQGALAIDQDRDSRVSNTSVKILTDTGVPGRQGETSRKLAPSVPLAEQLDSAIESARATNHEAWSLPASVPARLPSIATADPRIAEDIESVMSELTQRISKAATLKRKTEFNSSELFLSIHDQEMHLSNGLTHRSSQSRIYVEAAFSMSSPTPAGKTQSDEYLSTAWAVSLEDLSVENLFDETSARAEASLDVEKPVSGHYSVIVDAEVLSTLLGAYINQLNATSAYNRLPFIAPGAELIPGAEGDLLTISLDPSLPYGADSCAVSGQGVEQKPLQLVDKNRVMASLIDQQYAQYLGQAATTVRGNLVVGPGSRTFDEMRMSAPTVIEVLQFSSIFPDPNRGMFSSEIRLARVYDNVRGTVGYLKGGSLSGSLGGNFKFAYFSSNQVKRSVFSSHEPTGHGYYGPDYALLKGVSVVS